VDSRTAAESEATKIRAAILANAFRAPAAPTASQPASASLSLDEFAPVYIQRVAKASGKVTWKEDGHRLALLCDHRTFDGRRLGERPLEKITEDELEAFHIARRSDGRASSTLNHEVQVIKAAFRWAAKKGYTPGSPISEGSMLRRKKVAQRRRRLRPGEESQLLEAAGRVTRGASLRLQWLIIAALETGARVGELLALQWTDVNLEKRTLFIRATETGAKKTGRARLLPMSARLAAVFDMAQTDPAGRRYPPTAYVFGQLGERVRSVKKAWTTACEEANLSDLHFHDLRHEAGSRWLEAGWPIHFVKEMLGHSNISQTDTYLNASAMGLQDAMRRFDDLRCTRVAQIPAKELRPVCNEDPRDADKGLLH
jgi:integrase